ncbi:hypothetical protein [Alteribacter keqinensis]|uniref:Rhodanese domain-containing protein n=1 Tax=Alteribacter keqinensis TaxID=2483800 RepID=A0A3M7TLB8_9BACI|nr:hypothetical protein [Alteribacter keqinensis]RNA66268.1 hypothetical protein EBO34_19295 [Alteribacter keqinensis]
MQTAMLIIAVILAARSLYKRYVPVIGVSCMNVSDMKEDGSTIVDLRDFQTAHHDPLEGAVNMPMAYIYRHYKDIGQGTVYLVSSDMTDIHLTARFLKRKKIRVEGFSLTTEVKPCKKGREVHGV